METIGTWWMWAGFLAIVLVMLAIDLFVVGGGKEHKVSVREAATWSVIWIAIIGASVVLSLRTPVSGVRQSRAGEEA